MILTGKEKEEFVKQNLGLVHSLANKFRGRGIEYDDLFGAGCVGILKAIDGFDDTRGLKFSTYAVPVILGEIKRLFRDGGAVKISRGLKELSLKAMRERERFMLKNFREPTVCELADILGVSAEEAVEAISASVAPISLTADDDSHSAELDIKVEPMDEKIAEIIALKEVLCKLEARDRKLIMLRYFCGKTQTQTAQELDMTQVQVSRREKKILTALRAQLCV